MDRVIIREALERILASDVFQKAKRSSALLRYLVEEALEGRADRLKGTTIAQDVFGRDASFESNVDPIVRVQAGRMRSLLDTYYAGPGSDDTIRIVIPKGGYTPQFETRAPSESAGTNRPGAAPRPPRVTRRFGVILTAAGVAAVALFAVSIFFQSANSASRLPTGPKIYVAPFASSSEDAVAETVAQGFQIELIDRLSRFKNLFVFGADTTFSESGAPLADSLRFGATTPEFVLTGTIDLADGRFAMTSQLTDVVRSNVVWSDTFNNIVADPADIEKVKEKIVSEVAAALGQPYGVIDSYMKRTHSGIDQVSFGDYICLLSFYDYARQKNAEDHAAIRDCLEAATEKTPSWSMGWAALSWIYGDEERYGYNRRAEPAPYIRALEAAKKAVAADPYNATAHEYLSVAYFMLGDDSGALDAADQSLALNPNDSESLAWASHINIYLDRNSARARALNEKALRLNPGHPPWFNHGLAILDYRNRNYDDALRYALYGQDESSMSKVLLTATLVRLGRLEDAHAQWIDLYQSYPDVAEDPAPMLRTWRLEEALIDRMRDDIEKAGAGKEST